MTNPAYVRVILTDNYRERPALYPLKDCTRVTYSQSSSYHHSNGGFSHGSGLGLFLKLLALTSVIAIALITGIALGRGESPADWLDSFRDSPETVEPSDPRVIASQSDQPGDPGPPPQTSDPQSIGEGASALSQQEDQPGEPAAGDDNQDDSELSIASGQSQEPEEPSDAEAAAESEFGELANPVDIVTLFTGFWAEGDYDSMYDLLTTEAQETIARQEFIDRYTGIMQEAGVVDLTVTVTGSTNSETQTPIQVEMESSQVGTISQENAVQTLQQDGGWRVAWTPSLIFSGLGERCIEFTNTSMPRGSILDRDGDSLAYEGVVNQVGIVPGQLENETQTIAALSRLLDMSTADIKDRYEGGEPEWFMPITELPDPLDNEVLNSISNMPGVAVRERASRIYPLGPVTAHVTGYVTPINAEDIENDETGEMVAGELIGRAGIEAAANDILAGKPGGRLSIVSCATRVEQELIAERQPVEPQDIVLTIDADFQRTVDEALGDVSGSAVIINPQNGAIMALVSHPTFDPNVFVKGLSEKDVATIYDEKKRPLLNRATQQGYPTGSIFKVITFAAAMEHLGFEGGSEIYCPTDWSIPGTDQIWRDWTYEYGTGDQGMLNLHTALVNSCNTVFYELGYQLDEKDNVLLPEMTLAFGLGAPTGIPYLQEIGGTVPTPEWKLANIDDYWATGDAVNLAIGQGFLEATPLQMANAYAAIANGGTLLQPFIVESLRDLDGGMTVVGKRTEIREIPVDQSVIDELQSALRDQTSNSWGAGSVSVFGDFNWPIAGKTGTAQNQINRAEKPHSWYAAFGPYGEEAEITTMVMVESVGEGVSFAAPTTREILLAWLGS